MFDENNFINSKRFQHNPIQFQFTFEQNIDRDRLRLQIPITSEQVQK